jgi:hypothetical protein
LLQKSSEATIMASVAMNFILEIGKIAGPWRAAQMKKNTFQRAQQCPAARGLIENHQDPKNVKILQHPSLPPTRCLAILLPGTSAPLPGT